eukprot:9492682-Pyramimonas_sp.AAC.1
MDIAQDTPVPDYSLPIVAREGAHSDSEVEAEWEDGDKHKMAGLTVKKFTSLRAEKKEGRTLWEESTKAGRRVQVRTFTRFNNDETSEFASIYEKPEKESWKMRCQMVIKGFYTDWKELFIGMAKDFFRGKIDKAAIEVKKHEYIRDMFKAS